MVYGIGDDFGVDFGNRKGDDFGNRNDVEFRIVIFDDNLA